jgi:anhydro-N-acetylmuramic acid kinase
MDAIDTVLIDVEEGDGKDDITHVDSAEYSYRPETRQELLEVASNEQVSLEAVSRLNSVVGEEFGDAVLAFADDAGIDLDEVAIIGTYGQTVRHYPRGDPPSTFQLIQEQIVAEKTGVDTAADFFVRDLAAGGAGAPMLQMYDYIRYAGPDENRLIVNIGGIANVTYLPAGGDLDDVRAFDVGPGNMLVDATVRDLTDGEKQYDEDGERAFRGEVNEAVLADLLDHDFIKRAPPKSSGRDDFGEYRMEKMRQSAADAGVEGNDLVATFTALTGAALAYNREEFIDGPVDRVVVFGGGSQNPAIMSGIEERFDAEVSVSDELGYRHELREVQGVSYIAYRSHRGKQTNVPAATGSHPVCGGSIARGQIERD